MCIAAENDTELSESGYTSGSEGSDSSDPDGLPLGYSVSFDRLCNPVSQQHAGVQNIVIVFVQPGTQAPCNSEATSVVSVQTGAEAPYNSEVTPVSSGQHDDELFFHVVTPAVSETQPVPLNPDESNNQNNDCFCGCFSVIKNFFR